MLVQQPMQTIPAQAAHKVNKQEQPFGECVFYPDTEHPQKPHVPQDMPEA
jgi:hypothetical protein